MDSTAWAEVAYTAEVDTCVEGTPALVALVEVDTWVAAAHMAQGTAVGEPANVDTVFALERVHADSPSRVVTDLDKMVAA